jgi:hypothetical protein
VTHRPVEFGFVFFVLSPRLNSPLKLTRHSRIIPCFAVLPFGVDQPVSTAENVARFVDAVNRSLGGSRNGRR